MIVEYKLTYPEACWVHQELLNKVLKPYSFRKYRVNVKKVTFLTFSLSFFFVQSIIRSMMYLVPNFAADVVSDSHISSQSILELCSNARYTQFLPLKNTSLSPLLHKYRDTLVEFHKSFLILICCGIFPKSRHTYAC